MKRLWINKFPNPTDNRDVGACEMVVQELAVSAGVSMAEAKIERYASKQHIFLTKRFDRTETGE